MRAALILLGCSGLHACGFTTPASPGFGGGGGGGGDTTDAALDGAGTSDARMIDAPPPTWMVVDTLTVPCVQQAVMSTFTLQAQVTYRLHAFGTCTLNVANGSLGDAEYYQFNIAVTADTSMGVDVGIGIDDLVVDAVRTPRWGSYTTTHDYTVDWIGAGARITALFHDSNYSNNAGTLSVEILALQ